MAQVKMIKADAQIQITVGTNFLKELQGLLFYLAKEATPESLEQYKKLAEAKQPFTEDWMTHITTVSILLKEIEGKAEEQGFVYDGEIPDDLDSIQQEN